MWIKFNAVGNLSITHETLARAADGISEGGPNLFDVEFWTDVNVVRSGVFLNSRYSVFRNLTAEKSECLPLDVH